ncbi:fused MFS/spermidine synthase, partial [Chloroflexota bacterium]
MKQWGRIQAVILILFFLSGACGLIYEVAWQRMLYVVFGNTTFATATIIASFMGGLALGSFCFGRLVDKYKKPLRLYAYLEVGIGIFAIVFPFILSGISAIYIGIYQHLHTTFYFSSLIKFVLCFLVLLVPSFLMGGTLPVISKFLVRKFEGLGWSVGSLYGINTLGGVVGAFGAGFFFISLLGVRETTYAAAAVNILIAGVVLGWNRFLVSDDFGKPQPRREKTGVTGQRVYPKYTSHIILLVYALSGFCALAYEVLWTRVLVFSLGNTTYVFTTMLTTFLLGLALGSLIFSKFLDKGKHLLILLASIEVFIGLFTILPIWQFTKLGNFINDYYVTLGSSWHALVGARYLGSFFIMFIPALLMGITFPLVNKIYIENFTRLGRSIGNLYSTNALGCIVGSFMAGFVLIPLIGITKSIMLIALVNLILGAIILFSSLFARHRVRWATIVVVVTLVVVGITLTTAPSIKLQTVGYAEKLIYYKEGSSSTVAVVQDEYGWKILKINGVGEVPTDYSALRTFHMLGHLPLLLHKNPQKALIVAFGAGITSGAVAKHPLQQIDAVEISAEVIEANDYYLKENQGILTDPRLNLIIDDGRNYLLYTRNRYDVITSDATHPIASDSWVLYTREFYELCRRRLNPDGIMAQWLPLHNLAPVDYRTIIKTFQTVFPDTTLWLTDEYSILVGTKKELTIDFTLLTQRLEDEKIKEDLEEFNLDDPIAFLSTFVMGKESIARYTWDVQINTDNHPFVGFAERRKERDSFYQNRSHLRSSIESIFPLLTNM